MDGQTASVASPCSIMQPDMEHSESAPVEALLRHRGKLLGFIRTRVGDDDLAEDLFQEAVLRAIRAAPDLADEQQLLAWIYRVLRNAIIHPYRRTAADERRVCSAAAAMPDHAPPPELERELCACFVELLPALRPEYRDLIEKVELGDESPEAAAARLGIDRNNLKVRRHRARQQLKQRLEESCRACAKHGCLDCTCKDHHHDHSHA